MKNSISRMKLWGVGAIVLGSLFWFFSTNLKRSDDGTWSFLLLQDATFFLSRTKATSVSWVDQMYHRYVSLVQASRNNEVLTAENTILKTKLMVLEEQGAELQRLRQLFEFTRKFEMEFVVTEVAPGRKDSPFLTMTALKGRSSGLASGMPVVTAEGIIGKLLRVGQMVSEIQLLTDMDFNLDVLLQRTRVRGILNGAAEAGCKLNLPRGTDVRIGDLVVTSGIVGSFPKGIAVGKVVKISFDNSRVSQLVTVEPVVDWRRVEEVVVLNRRDNDLTRIFNQAGEQWIQDALKAKGG